MKLTEAEKELVERTKCAIEANDTTPFSPQWVEKLLAIITRLDQEPDIDLAYKDGYDTGYMHGGNKASARQIISDAPTVNTKLVRQGQWIKLRDWDYYVCSNCYRKAPCNADGTEWLAELCNKCGAKMNTGRK